MFCLKHDYFDDILLIDFKLLFIKRSAKIQAYHELVRIKNVRTYITKSTRDISVRL